MSLTPNNRILTKLEYVIVPSIESLSESIEYSAKFITSKFVEPKTENDFNIAINSAFILCAIRSMKSTIELLKQEIINGRNETNMV
jgi:hypothetical protein